MCEMTSPVLHCLYYECKKVRNESLSTCSLQRENKDIQIFQIVPLRFS
jgi:hypothetical protein